MIILKKDIYNDLLFEKIQMHYGICIFTIWPARLRCPSYPPLGTSYPAWREGVGAESEARAVMLQGGGQGLRIHTVFQRKGCEGVPKIGKPNMFHTNDFFLLLVDSGLDLARKFFAFCFPATRS